MFIMRWLGNVERPSDMDHGAFMAYNKMHVGYCVRVEWGIDGLKRKFQRLMKRFDATKPKYDHWFIAMALLMNFMHQRGMDFAHDVMDDQLESVDDHGCQRRPLSVCISSAFIEFFLYEYIACIKALTCNWTFWKFYAWIGYAHNLVIIGLQCTKVSSSIKLA